MSTEVSEVTILAILMHNPDLAPKVFSMVPVEQFDPPMVLVAEAIQSLRVSGHQVDPNTVTEEMLRRGTLNRAGGTAEIWRINEFYISDAAIDYHLEIVVENRALRTLWRTGTRLVAASERAEEMGVRATDLARDVMTTAQGVLDRSEVEDVHTETLAEMLSSPDDPYDWVIPNLLERMERFILTGTEGLGKSTLFRQLAVCSAAGVHPFTGAMFDPQRVLYIDVENSRRQSRRKLRPMALAVQQLGRDPGDNLLIECRPGGIDLTSTEDEQWFISLVAAHQPAILFTGPIYKLFVGNANEEEQARRVAAVLDRARASADCALVLEAHSGHGTEGHGGGGPRRVRPLGSSLWLRWPEFGYGIRPGEGHTTENRIVDMLPWRGDRDERDWPQRMRAGGSLPWTVASTYDQPWTPTVHQGGGVS